MNKREIEKFANFYTDIAKEGYFSNKNMSEKELKVRQLCNTATKRAFRKFDPESSVIKFVVTLVLPRNNNFPIYIEDRYWDFELSSHVLAFEKLYNCHLDRFYQDLTDYFNIHINFKEDNQ